MSEAEQNRSEQPTPHKLARAREKGTVARGQDLGFLTAMAAFLGYFWLIGPSLGAQIAQTSRGLLVTAPGLLASSSAMLGLTGAVMASLARPVAFMAGAVFLVVLVFEIVQTGPVFSTETFRLDFSRLNPATGFKRIVSLRMQIETLKNIVKLAVYTALTGVVLVYAARTAIASVSDAVSLAAAMRSVGLRLMTFFLGAAAVFALIDQMIARRDFLRRMRMSRREVRREARDREGEPRMKQRRKALHREFAKVSQSVRNIRGADVLIVNPVHLAVALKYDPRQLDAPIVVSRGAHETAQRLKRLAFVYGVAVVENKALAQALYRHGELNHPVPAALFRPVADIYLTLRRAAAKPREEAQSA
jgi:flagellar biosynthesis protein FlhB